MTLSAVPPLNAPTRAHHGTRRCTRPGSKLTKWAGWIITAAGTGHTLGSLIQTVPHHLGTWFSGQLWGESAYSQLSAAASGFWYSVYSFGPPMLLIGITVLWMEKRDLRPPTFIAWSMAAWVVLTFVAAGPSPLPVLLVAAAMLLVESRRQSRTEPRHTADPSPLMGSATTVTSS